MNIKTYALSVAVVVIITEISDLLLPSGKMKNSVRTVFSILTILIFSSPAISFFKNEFNFSEIFETTTVEVDQNFIDYSYQVRNKLLEDEARRSLKNEGIEFSSVRVETENSFGVINVKKIEINLGDLVINENEWHIYKSRARTVVATALKVDEKVVTII